MAQNLKFAQLQTFYIYGAGVMTGATSITLKSMKDIDGNPLTMSTAFGLKGFGTLQPNSKEFEEQISFTGLTNNANGTTTLTGVSSVTFLDPYTETSGLLKTHPGSTVFIVSNTSGFENTMSNRFNDGEVHEVYTYNSQSEGANPVIDDANYVQVLPTELVHKQYVDSIVAGGGTLPPVVVDVNSATSGAVQVASLTYDVTFSGVNRGCLIQVATEEAQTITGITVGGVAAALIIADTDVPNNLRHETWFLAAPILGLQSIVVTLSGAAYIASGAEALTGVDQATPTGTTGSDTGTTTTPTVTIATTYDNSLVFDGFATTGTLPVTATVGVSQTNNWQELTGIYQGASSYEPAGMATDSITNDYLLNQSTDWVITSVEVKGISTASPGSNLTVEQEAVVVETTVDTINFTGNVSVTNPSAGQVNVDILGGGGGSGGTLIETNTTIVNLNGSVAETDLFVINIPGGTLGTGNAVRFQTTASALTTGSGARNITFRAYYGGNLFATLITPGSLPGIDATMRGVIIASGTTNGQKSYCDLLMGDSSFNSTDNEHNTIATDSTNDEDLRITGQLNNVGDACTSQAIVVESITISSAADKKKVGVGETDDIQFVNFQYQFGAVGNSLWDIVGGSASMDSPMRVTLQGGDYFEEDSGTYSQIFALSAAFDDLKQRIFQLQAASTTSTGDDLCGIGFNIFNSNDIRDAQGTNAVSVGFVRKGTDGTWYARSADGAAFTETLITVSDGTHTWRCEYDPAVPSVRYYLDGTLVATHGAGDDIPSADTNVIGFCAGNGSTGINTQGINAVTAPSFAEEI